MVTVSGQVARNRLNFAQLVGAYFDPTLRSPTTSQSIHKTHPGLGERRAVHAMMRNSQTTSGRGPRNYLLGRPAI